MNTQLSPNFADTYMTAFPADDAEILIQHADSTARSSFSVCRVCGSMVLASMTVTHTVQNHTN